MKVADKDDINEFTMSAMKNFWDGKRGFDKGLPLLKRGERGVFRYRASGYLGWHAAFALEHAQRIMDPQEYVHDWMKNKDVVIQAWENVSHTKSYTGGGNEPGYSEEPAPFGSKTVLDEEFYGPFNFPSALPDIPPPTNITIQTGEPAPVDGIWEPEWTMQWVPKGSLARIVDFATVGKPDRHEKGCMNYLLADTIAPTYKDGPGEPELPVTWRLIWEDTRYRDGTIPEEEAQYLAPPAPPAPTQPQDRLSGQPGETVPKTGTWWTPAFPATEGTRHFKQGERFPTTATTQYGAVIWYYTSEGQARETPNDHRP
jgi:hypothetical protein